MTESRLERLLKLIDTAQSPAYRRLAAKQLGSLIQSQPNQARSLLQKLDGLMSSKNWDTRIACAYAVEYIFTALPAQFTDNFDCASTDDGQLLKEMDLATEIRSRKALLASAGAEFDLDLTISAAERLKISRANVKKTLGFDGISGMEELEKELVKDEDLSTSTTASIAPVVVVDLEKLSARERIAMKRKARLKSSQEPVSKHLKKSTDNSNSSSALDGSTDNLVSASSSALEAIDGLESDALWFCERMKEKLLNPNWHVRHAALLGLRGVLGRGIPVMSEADCALMSESQEGWLDFVLCDILLILGLDRFGDFIGDQVISPVKETAAQLLALIYKRLGSLEKRSCLVTRHIRVLMEFDQWQVRHAGLLSLKHILSSVSDVEIAGKLSCRVIELLSDGDEDVRSVSAEVLSSLLSSGRHSSIDLSRTFKTLQGLLQDLDEVSPSVAPVLDLLGHLVVLDASFEVQSGLLLPFLRHSSVKVRKQVVKVLGAMNTATSSGEDMRIILIQLIQSLAIELDREISDLTLALTLDLITISENSCIKFSGESLDKLFEIASCPLGRPYSLTNFSFLTGPASHDLAFKKSDMMLISEEEGMVQRMNVSKVLKCLMLSALKPEDEFDLNKYKLALATSPWCIQKLVHLWIFGCVDIDPSSCVVFSELSALLGSLQGEFNRFKQLIGGSAASFDASIVVSSIEEFRTRSEKSVEALNQLSVLETVLCQFESENSKLKARLQVCTSLSNDLCTSSLIEAIKLDSNARLQEFYALELVAALGKNAESLNLALLESLGAFVDLRAISVRDNNGGSDEVISVQRDWIDYRKGNDNVWRGGQFVFREFSKSAVLVSKSLALLSGVTDHETNCWLVALLQQVKDKRISELVVDKLCMDQFDLSGGKDELLLASWAFAFSQLVRLEILGSPTTACPSSKSLERFLREILFKSSSEQVFPVVLELLNRTEDVAGAGAAAAAAVVVSGEGNGNVGGKFLLPLVPVFLKRTLMEINDSDAKTRKFASLTFSQLVRLAPLAASEGDKFEGFSLKTEKLIGECREFLDQLQGPSTSLPDFIPACPLNVQMRPYQQAGLNWLAFLRRFNLHGALCDDMGLGKTLQTLSIIASDHFERCEETPKPRSLIVCPASLTGHWEAEIRQYCPSLKEAPLVYVGSAAQRHTNAMQKRLDCAEIVVTSYDVLRSDSEYLTGYSWNYCVLDEGHLIKNPRTKLSCAVRGLKAKRRLLLSGTPIQNNLLELWALFDFLLPGYLGTEKEFTDRYAKPILILQHQQSVSSNATPSSSTEGSSSLSKWTQRDFDDAEKRLEALHKQVLPFILRRMKEDVLSDLPPKIIQDYKCPMSSVQRILYDDLLAGSGIRSEITKFVKEKLGSEDVETEDTVDSTQSVHNIHSTHSTMPTSGGKPTHVFQVLQYLRKLCVHPSLCLSENSSLLPAVTAELERTKTKLTDLSVAPKFQMLKELLMECGLGSGGNGDEGTSSSLSSSGNHRVLIFAQHKSTLDLIEELVFRPHLPGISFLRLDGGVEASARYPIVSKFNTDLTIDVLLLTTHVGGLGLNLTSADTVIFMDPDWNPMKDLQAMDRAHRLGQKRVVTVYRLLLQDTLEDRIMSLQRWKTRVAGTVITQQNSEAVNHENLLDLFDSGTGEGQVIDDSATNHKKTKGGPSSTPSWHVDDDSDLARREQEYQSEFNNQ